jgi:hypothetical protein
MSLYVVLVDVVSNFGSKKASSDTRNIYAKSGEVCKVVSMSGDVYICEKYTKDGTTYKPTGNKFPVNKNKIREI